MLAEARESKGWTVAHVAENLKLTSRQIEALEAEDYSRLPAAVFVRGFARNYARLLNLPADGLPGLVEPSVEPSTTITAPSEQLVFRTSPVRRWLLLPLAGRIRFMVLVAALDSWLRQGEDAYLTSGVQTPVVATPLPPAQTVIPQPAPPVGIPAALPKADDPAQPTLPVAPVPPATTPPAGAVPAAAPSAAPVVPNTHENEAATNLGRAVHLTVQDEDAWIEIVAADQKRSSRLLRAGEQMTMRGVPPLKLVIGNAAHVHLIYDDKPVDLHPYIGDKVARLTLE
jgi:cytoskeleton protein RodZ